MKARAVLFLVGLLGCGCVVHSAPVPTPGRMPTVSQPPKVPLTLDEVIAELEGEAKKYEILATEFFTYDVNPELNALLRGRAAAYREAIKIVRKAMPAPIKTVSRGR